MGKCPKCVNVTISVENMATTNLTKNDSNVASLRKVIEFLESDIVCLKIENDKLKESKENEGDVLKTDNNLKLISHKPKKHNNASDCVFNPWLIVPMKGIKKKRFHSKGDLFPTQRNNFEAFFLDTEDKSKIKMFLNGKKLWLPSTNAGL